MKPQRYFRHSITVVLILAASVFSTGQPAAPQPFSADFATTGLKGENATGKFFFSAPKVRMDMTSHGQNVSMIADSTSQTTYMVMHQQHMYMEVNGANNPMMRQTPKIATSYDPSNPCASTEATCKKVGTESINGRVCDKWQSTSAKGASTTWVDQQLHFPIKTASADGSGMEFSNIKEGQPDASLFQPPAGYRKMDLGGMMGGAQPPH